MLKDDRVGHRYCFDMLAVLVRLEILDMQKDMYFRKNTHLLHDGVLDRMDTYR